MKPTFTVCRHNQTKLSMRVALLLSLVLLFISCNKLEHEIPYTLEEKHAIYSKLAERRTLESQLELYKEYEGREDNLGRLARSIIALELGKSYRNRSAFSEALDYHRYYLEVSQDFADSIELPKALNNMATNFRRLGMLSRANDYHYQALLIVDQFRPNNSQDVDINRKSRVMALNGIGNIALSLGNYDEAIRTFKRALEDEFAMGSSLGQAINTANIGACYESMNKLDSAKYYYDLSMGHNKAANSSLGIGLCYNHYGDLERKQNKLKEALHSYKQAYEVLHVLEDTWHWLTASSSIVGILLEMDNPSEAKVYLDEALEAVQSIKSPEHLDELYDLQRRYYERMGNYQEALKSFSKRVQWNDSLNASRQTSRIVDARLRYENERNRQQIDEMRIAHDRQKHQKKLSLIIGVLVTVFLLFLLFLTTYSNRLRKQVNKNLRSLDKIRSDLFTNITHEFRTPLTVIMGQIDLLRRQESRLSDSEKKSSYAAIDRQGNYLLHLIEQLLDVAKARAGLLNSEWQRGNLLAYIEMIAESFNSYSKPLNRTIELVCAEKSIDMVFSPKYLQQVLQNLLSNALKYGAENTPIKLKVSKDESNMVQIAVCDQGAGISAEDLEHVFDYFYRSQNASNQQGSGIGLSFSKQLTERMGGELTAESKLGVGSCFYVRLPLVPKGVDASSLSLWTDQDPVKKYVNLDAFEPDEAFSNSLEAEEQISEKPSVLIVEDNPDVLNYIVAILQPSYHCICANNGQEGITLARRTVPDLIVVDRMMPIMDGMQFAFDVKNSNLLAHIPIIMLTAKASNEDRLEGLRMGVDIYMSKPFLSEELLLNVENLLALVACQRRSFAQVHNLDSSEASRGEVFVRKAEPCAEEFCQNCPPAVSVTEAGNELISVSMDKVYDKNTEFMNLLNEFVAKRIESGSFTTADVAADMSLSHSQVNRKLNAIAGCSLSVYIKRCKVQYGVQLLISTDRTVADIAEASGFADYSSFFRSVRALTGKSPREFRPGYSDSYDLELK